MKIRMLETVKGAHDGIHVKLYSKGETHDLSGSERELLLAKILVDAKHAEEVKTERKGSASPATSAAAPENKAVKPAENKGAGRHGINSPRIEVGDE